MYINYKVSTWDTTLIVRIYEITNPNKLTNTRNKAHYSEETKKGKKVHQREKYPHGGEEIQTLDFLVRCKSHGQLN